MTLDSVALLSKLETDLSHTTAKIYRPDSVEFNEIAQCFIHKPVRTPAVVRPRTADDVASVMQFCLRNKAGFTVRSGGYDCAARTRVDGALVIDMRDMNQVTVSEDKGSATVGGGILHGDLARALGEEGLATPVGNVASLGYTGWSTLGGYGPLSSGYGLGVDQILGAKTVNARGEIQTASEELLVGIRGGGGSLGIITELTIKVYPLDKVRDDINGRTGVDSLLTRRYYSSQMLSSIILYESSNLEGTITTYNQHYEHLLATQELSDCLQLQPTITQIPKMGTVFGVMLTWHGENKEEGYAWIESFAKAGTCVMKATQETTLAEVLKERDNLVTWPSYGRLVTLNLRQLTERTIAVLARHCPNAPGVGFIFSFKPRHKIRSLRLELEINTAIPESCLANERLEWGSRIKADLEVEDTDNILESSYIALGSHEVNLKRVYGQHYSTLMTLKEKYDPDNIFKHTVPRLAPVGVGRRTLEV
ncbi:unnamed protein product [Clonostachys byssicola]|uniref:FAD-binding PCMH-type domain-containing protein n=1 Tax=Clonostachys byssicola TaxID=160290 RepID=A0A9N9Y4E4_9HYPO|nr:unnamed protein product [Clonostachys byssicola]